MPDKLSYTVKEAAAKLGVSRATLYRLRDNGKITMVKLMGRTVITHASLVSLLNEEGGPKPPADPNSPPPEA